MNMADSPKISIAIVGGGIGGLSLAAGLQNCPHINVQVYEGTKVYKDVGGGGPSHSPKWHSCHGVIRG